MAPRRSDRAETSPLERAEELLEGRDEELSPSELMELIHAINPTKRTHLPPRAVKQAYALKNRLQSLLVATCKEQLVVEAGPTEGLVGIRHRYLPFDACHAHLTDLDDDAQSWIRFQLDAGSDAAEGSQARWVPPAKVLSELDQLISQARTAIAEFDYEAGKAALYRAMTLRGGSLRAVVPLLELLVETLGQDAEALGLEAQLSERLLDLPIIRTLLAVAASRLGEVARAQVLLGDLSGARALEVRLRLAQSALEAADLEKATLLVSEAEKDGATPELLALKERLKELRADERKPREALAEQAFERGDLEEARSSCRAILHRWPDSGPAKHLLHRIEDQERSVAQREALAAAEASHQSSDWAREVAALRSAIAAGAKGLDDRLRSAVESLRAREQALEVERVSSRLAQPDERALLDYLDLDAEARSRVRAGKSLPLLADLDDLAGRTRAAKAVAASLALHRATGLAGEQLLSTLEPHQELLSALPHVRTLMETARAEVASARGTAAVEALRLAKEALDEEDVELARDHLRSEVIRSLPAEHQAERERLETLLARSERTSDALTSLNAAIKARDILRALASAEELFRANDDPKIRERVAELWGRIQLSARAEWRSGWVPPASPERLPAWSSALLPLPSESPAIHLLDESSHFILVGTFGAHLFAAVGNAADGGLVRAGYARLPEVMRAPTAVCDGKDLVLAGGSGHISRLTLDDLSPRLWRSLAEFLPEKATLNDAFVVPKVRHLWLRSAAGHDSESRTEVVDLDAWRVIRKGLRGVAFALIPGGPEMFVASFDPNGNSAFYSSRGSSTPMELLRSARLHAMAVHPNLSPPGMILALSRRGAAEDESEPTLAILASQGRKMESLTIPECNADDAVCLATSFDARCVFVTLREGGVGDKELLAFEWDGSTLVQRWTANALNPSLTLLTDAAANKVLAVWPTAAELTCAVLGAEPFKGASLGDSLAPGVAIPNMVAPYWSCSLRGESGASEGAALTREFQANASGTTDPAFIRSTQFITRALEKQDDPDAFVVTVEQMERQCHLQDIPQVLSPAAKLHPGDGRILCLRVHQAIREGDWGTAGDLVEKIPAGMPDIEARAHRLHLAGIVRLHHGDLEGARQAWRECQAIDAEACNISGCLNLARGLLDPIPDDVSTSNELPTVARLAWLVRVADAALDRGDPEAAVRALDSVTVHSCRLPQTLGRLANAYLRATPRPQGGLAELGMAAALASFVDLARTGSSGRYDLPLGPAAWSAARIEQIEKEAAAWLEEFRRPIPMPNPPAAEPD